MDRTDPLLNTLYVDGKQYYYYDLFRLKGHPAEKISRLPYSLKILLESAIRQMDGKAITPKHIRLLLDWGVTRGGEQEIPFKPARVILQDFTGIPALVDLAAMRSAVFRAGGDPSRVNPHIPVDLVIDHSLIVETHGNPESLRENMDLEYRRNGERYRFLRWAQQSFRNFRVVPPGNGIVHQVNLEVLSPVVFVKQAGGKSFVYPDSLVGTDSHTTMINGLGVIGWGVGGIEAEAAMLGQAIYFRIPEVIGLKLTGRLPEGVTSTDLTLTLTELLRKKGVVGKFVEFFGPGLDAISVADRATIANMAPEYGATLSYFPLDAKTLEYLRLTGRPEALIRLCEAYYSAQGLFRTGDSPEPDYTEVLELDLSAVVPSLAGPKRPQDRIELGRVREEFWNALSKPVSAGGYGLGEEQLRKRVTVHVQSGRRAELGHGSVVLAAITSCTNTSNPHVMIGAGLLAKKAVEKGLRVPPTVKTSLTPGSKAVTEYLRKSGLLRDLEELGFHVDGYGCATCCGNSGPLDAEVSRAIREQQLHVAAVLSGNRNFEGRVHPLVRLNYLASPPLVVAYALAGTVNLDLLRDPIGHTKEGEPVYLREIWPASEEIEEVIRQTIRPELYVKEYRDIFAGDERWNQLPAQESGLYPWDPASTYIQEPPYFQESFPGKTPGQTFSMRALALLGDSITTDHISPVGSIPGNSPAGIYLSEKGISPAEFNSYGSRRGNHHVMIRGTFANIRLRNKMVPGMEGGYTRYLPTDEVMTIYEAAMRYREQGIPLIVIAGKEYGTGSSRDWAAKGTRLLGVKVVLAESFERIHRSNLVGMGVLPLEFKEGEGAATYHLDGTEEYILKIPDRLEPGQDLRLKVRRRTGEVFQIETNMRLDSPVEIEYYQKGGILPFTYESILSKED